MKLLIDTHVLLWWLADDARIGGESRDVLADPRNDVLYSVVSLWEIVVKMRIGKLLADISTVSKGLLESGFLRLDTAVPHLESLAGLPTHHRDPFDHLLMAQAIAEKAIFLSDDWKVGAYPVQVMHCSD